MDRGDRPSRAELDLTGSRRRRVIALRDLVDKLAYEIRAEDVADSIIKDALVVAPPAAEPRH